MSDMTVRIISPEDRYANLKALKHRTPREQAEFMLHETADLENKSSPSGGDG